MARMLPARIGRNVASAAERQMFRRLRTDLSDEWVVLHSLGLARHERKPWAEIDFVLTGPAGVYCLEVKGGRVSRTEGGWEFTDRKDRTHLRHEGPFGQAASAAAALRHWLVRTDQRLSRIAVGHGVVMPDVRFEISGPDIDGSVLLDARDIDNPISRYIDRLSRVWLGRIKEIAGRPPVGLSALDVDRVAELMRGDFDLRPSLRARVREANAELIRLTDEQYRVLDGLAENPRVIIRGGAGTGKTLLAVEEARRLAHDGARVLVCCFGRRLAEFLRRSVAGEKAIDVDHVHGLMRTEIEAARYEGRLPAAEPDDLFRVFYPELCVEALIENDRLGEYGAVIVDEGQDVLSDSYIDVLDAVLDGGIADGTWRVFLDHRQDVFQASGPTGMGRIERARPASYRLTVNCRNTEPIAVAAASMTGLPVEETLEVQGPDVEYVWYRDDADLRRRLGRHLSRLRSQGIKAEEIVVLSSRRLENSAIAEGLDEWDIATGDRKSASENLIEFATIASFKGLEADAVALIGIDDLHSRDVLMSTYVGASRARAVLTVFARESVRGDLSDRARDFGARQVATSTGNGHERR